MNIDKLFLDKEYLEKEINFFINKKQIKKIDNNPELVKSHLKKARHNAEFYKLNNHSALALITNKNYSSKNHYATILILIKEYSITKDEAKLLSELSINKEDAELYTNLKEDRHDASYTTNSRFSQETINDYENKVLDFINKTEELIQK